MSAEANPWDDIETSLPELDQPVYLCIMRKAKRVDDGQGGWTWKLSDDSPIDLKLDAQYYMLTNEASG
jgi:hypothetical protein